MTTSADPSPGSYTITGGEQGKRRLDLLAEIMQPTTLRLLAEAGLRGGDRCPDLSCGGGNVTQDMARIAGQDGSVTGVDFDPQIVALARQDARDAGVGSVEYHVADARAFDGGPFGSGPPCCATAWPPIRKSTRSSTACTRSPGTLPRWWGCRAWSRSGELRNRPSGCRAPGCRPNRMDGSTGVAAQGVPDGTGHADVTHGRCGHAPAEPGPVTITHLAALTNDRADLVSLGCGPACAKRRLDFI